MWQLKIEKKIHNWVKSAACSRQIVMQKDSIEALHQNWDPLVQEAGLSSLARVFRDPPSKVIEVTSWCVKNAQGLYRNWLKDVRAPRSTYVSSLQVAAICAAAPASRAALSLYDSASGHVTVTSQQNDVIIQDHAKL